MQQPYHAPEAQKRMLRTPLTPEQARAKIAARQARLSTPPTISATPKPASQPCPVCTGSGFRKTYVDRGRYSEWSVDGNKRYDIEPCANCQQDRVADLKWRKARNASSMTDDMREMTFASWDSRRAPSAYAAACLFADDPSGWLLLYGPAGGGKTHLLSAIAQHRLGAGQSALYVVAPELIEFLKAAFSENDDERRQSVRERLDLYRTADLLLLDDIGAEQSTLWTISQFYLLFDFRYRQRLPTVVTTNLKPADLRNLDYRMADRLLDVSLTTQIEMNEKSYRKVPVSERRRGGVA